MALRFRRSIKLAPGLRLNVGKKGASISAGVRGARITMGTRGVHGSVGAPGTGLSYRQKLTGPPSSKERPRSSDALDSMGAQLSLMDDGNVKLIDSVGNPLPPRFLKLAREQNKEQIDAWIHEQCEQWNKGIEDILNIHLATPPTTKQIVFEPEPFEEKPPTSPVPKSLGLIGRIFKSKKESIIRENEQAIATYREEKLQWEKSKRVHEDLQVQRKKIIEEGRFSDPQAMQDFLADVLSKIDWPRETLVSFQVDENGACVLLDVDLPEIEDMPTEQASVGARGLKINIKNRAETQRRKEYMNHIHAVAFRVIGETFVALPTVQRIVCSGYSQRPDKATGQITDEYLFSVRLKRTDWEKINFANLPSIDLPSCLDSFEIRRKMTKTGIFSSVTPFDSANF